MADNTKDLLELLKRKREESEKDQDKTIKIVRSQVSVNNPAIAQVIVIFPDSLKNGIDPFFTHFHKKYSFRDIVYKFEKTDDGSMVELRSNLAMYKWFEILIIDYSNYFKRNYPSYIIKVSGSWTKYG